MRRLLLCVIVLEGTVLFALAAVAWLRPDGLRAEPPARPVFRPSILDARAGEEAEYELHELGADGKPTGVVLGFFTYRVLEATEIERTSAGRILLLEMVRTDARNRRETRQIRRIPRYHGYFPPRFDELELPAGDSPVLKTLRSTPVRVRDRVYPGFEVEAVRPRWGLREVRDRLAFSERVPVFGMVRRESDGVLWILRHMAGAPR